MTSSLSDARISTSHKSDSLATTPNNAYSNVKADLWATYLKYRPAYPHSLFQRIYTYHVTNGGSFDGTAHDAGCGPGITAEILALQFKHLICSDFSESAIDAAREHVLEEPRSPGKRKANAHFTFKVSSAEDMSWIPANSLEMVTMSEALHWTDTARTLEAAHRVLKPGRTFAAWYYTQPRFPDNEDVNNIFREIQAYWCKLRRDFSPESERTLWVEQTGYDCIAFPPDQWIYVQRIKFNTGGNKDIWIRDDDLSHMRYESQVAEDEAIENVEDAVEWQQEADLDFFRGWFMSASPQLDGEYFQSMLGRLESALRPSGRTRAMWPVVVLLASKR